MKSVYQLIVAIVVISSNIHGGLPFDAVINNNIQQSLPIYDMVDDGAPLTLQNNRNPWTNFWSQIFQPTTTTTTDSSNSGDSQPDDVICDIECKCGLPNTDTRIVGGNETIINEYPWMGLITFGTRLHCGSSLISDRYLLTAAHCVKGFNVNRFTVTLLEHDRMQANESPAFQRKIASAVIHPRFNDLTYDNDIAIMRMDRTVALRGKLRPVCLPLPRFSFAGAKAVVTGWGDTSENGLDSGTLQQVEVPVLSNRNCRATGYGESRITDNMLCAGYAEGGRDSCQGDSGGPLHVHFQNIHQVAGIVSFGDGCAEPNYPGVYTRVNRFLSWIGSNTYDSCYCGN